MEKSIELIAGFLQYFLEKVPLPWAQGIGTVVLLVVGFAVDSLLAVPGGSGLAAVKTLLVGFLTYLQTGAGRVLCVVGSAYSAVGAFVVMVPRKPSLTDFLWVSSGREGSHERCCLSPFA